MRDRLVDNQFIGLADVLCRGAVLPMARWVIKAAKSQPVPDATLLDGMPVVM